MTDFAYKQPFIFVDARQRVSFPAEQFRFMLLRVIRTEERSDVHIQAFDRCLIMLLFSIVPTRLVIPVKELVGKIRIVWEG